MSALTTPRLILQALAASDTGRLLTYELRNRARFAPHGPRREDADFTPEACAARIAAQLREVERGGACRWLLLRRDGAADIVGHATLSNLQRGVRHAAFLGYGVDREHAGQGLASEALGAVVAHAFGPLNLHRLEAAHRPDNFASARVLAKLGFTREGLARDYLYLDGRWQDQVLNALCNPAWIAPT